MIDYESFIDTKTGLCDPSGFAPVFMPDALFDFQKSLVDWSLRQGRSAIFADCGLGKTAVQLAWAHNVVRKTNGRVLVLTPLAVSKQTVREGEKFGLPCSRSADGKPSGDVTVTNYEKLHHFDPSDYAGVILDESSILKNFSGRRRSEITWFMKKTPYRLLCTATAAPNDYVELGTSSEALGHMAHMDMLKKFFRATDDKMAISKGAYSLTRFSKNAFGSKYRFKEHAKRAFWRWVCSWARALRAPSDLGFDDDGFVLPDLLVDELVVETKGLLPGYLFPMPAVGLEEQRAERRLTIPERAESVAEHLDGDLPGLAWCHLNDEGDALEDAIPDAIQVKGSQSDEEKEELLEAFSLGQARVLVTKPSIAGFGLNWQHCSRMTFFPSHSFEQYYQAVRRCWRFGQKNPVTVSIITTEGEKAVLSNLKRKADAAAEMFEALVDHMNDALHLKRERSEQERTTVPSWL